MTDGGALFAESPLQRYLAELDATAAAIASAATVTRQSDDQADSEAQAEPQVEPQTSTAQDGERLALAAQLLACPLLLDDDALLLHALDASLFKRLPLPPPVASVGEDAETSPDNWQRTAGKAALVASLCLLLPPVGRRYGWGYKTTSVVTASIVAAGGLVWWWKSRRQTSMPQPSPTPETSSPARLGAQLASLSALNQLVARALRQVQHVELLSRGYSLGHPWLPPIARIEQAQPSGSGTASQPRRCRSLRLCIDAVLRAHLEVVRGVTKELTQTIPVLAWDAADRLHADVPLQALGQCLDLL